MDVQSFLNNFLDESNKTVLFATMAVVLVVLILLISLIRKRKKKKLEEKTAAAIDKAMSGDEDDLAKDSSDSNTLAQDNIILDDRSDSTESRILAQDASDSNTLVQDDLAQDYNPQGDNLAKDSNSGEEFSAHHPYDNFGSDYKDYDDDIKDIDNSDDTVAIDNSDDTVALAQNTPAEEYNLYTNYNEGFNSDLNNGVVNGTEDVEVNVKDSENDPMEELLDEENDDIYNSDFVDGFFGTLAKNDSKESPKEPEESTEEFKESSESPKEPEESQESSEESKEPPVELILHDQISVEENTPKEEEEKEKEAPEENKKAAITLVDGSDRVMVSVGEKFESKHKKEFTIDVTNEPEIKIALQDGFVFDGRVHFLVSFSEALAQHVSLKDVREIAEYKGDYSGYEIQLEVTDKGDLETIDCTRTFNYKKIKDAVLIIQLSLE